MSTTEPLAPVRHDQPVVMGRLLPSAALVTGAAFALEAVVSVLVDAHVGYHALNTVLNAALVVCCVVIARSGRATVGRIGVIGARATALMALLAAGGGVWTVAVEGLTSTDTPGAVDGIAHTAVLASILFLVPLGLGVRRVDRVAGLILASSSACLVVMVLVGLDQPEAFLAPEALLGVGWLLLGRRLATGATR